MRKLAALNYGVYVFSAEGYFKNHELLNKLRAEFGFRAKTNILMAELS